MYYTKWQDTWFGNRLQHTATHCNTLTCSLLRSVAVCFENEDRHNFKKFYQGEMNQACALPRATSASAMGRCVCSSVLQCVVVCCSLLQSITVCASKWHVCECYGQMCVLQCVAACCSVLQRVAACCSVLQSVAACCSVMQQVYFSGALLWVLWAGVCVAVYWGMGSFNTCAIYLYTQTHTHMFSLFLSRARTHIPRHTHTPTHTHTQTHIHTYTHTYTHTHMHTCLNRGCHLIDFYTCAMNLYTQTHKPTHTRSFSLAHTLAHTHTHTCTRTHTHACMHAWSMNRFVLGTWR